MCQAQCHKKRAPRSFTHAGGDRSVPASAGAAGRTGLKRKGTAIGSSAFAQVGCTAGTARRGREPNAVVAHCDSNVCGGGGHCHFNIVSLRMTGDIDQGFPNGRNDVFDELTCDDEIDGPLNATLGAVGN